MAPPMLVPLLTCIGLHSGPPRAFQRIARSATSSGGDARGSALSEEIEASLFQSPAEAVVNSTVLRRGASVLLHVIRAEGGAALFDALLDRGLAQLQAEREDWEELLPEGPVWEAGNTSRAEAVEALRSGARLIDVGAPVEDEFTVRSVSGLTFTGTCGNEVVEFTLERRNAKRAWNVYAPFAVVTGPANLLGKRVTQVDSNDTRSSNEENPFAGIDYGDKLFLAEPDRAGITEILLHDHLPEMSGWLAPLQTLMDEADEGKVQDMNVVLDGDVVNSEDLMLEEDLKEAIRFSQLAEKIENDEERLRARMVRLSEFPAVKEFLNLTRGDKDWNDLLNALQPRSQAVYEISREYLLNQRNLIDPKAVVVELGETLRLLVFVILAFIVACVVAVLKPFDAPQNPQDLGSQESLPLYTLQKDTAKKTVPILYGTPFMPSQ